MKKAGCILVFYLICVFPFVVNGQTQEETQKRIHDHYSGFKAEFEKEFGLNDTADLNTPPSNIHRVFFKTKLPDWVLDFPDSDEPIIYGIGISEPGMTKDSAFRLATLRAKAILCLLNETNISGLTDYYISEKNLDDGNIISSTYREFYKIVSSLTVNQSDFTIVNDTFTANNEAIILLSLRPGSELTEDSLTIRTYSEVSGTHNKKNNKYSTTARMELTAGELGPDKKATNYFQYIVKKYNKKAKIISNYSGATISCNTDAMTYQTNFISSEEGESFDLSYTLQKGLWFAFSSVLLETLVVNYNDTNAKQSGLYDQYNELSQNLNRTLSRKNISLRLKGLLIENNNLRIKTELSTQK
jgi:hypothetical protein